MKTSYSQISQITQMATAVRRLWVARGIRTDALLYRIHNVCVICEVCGEFVQEKI
jgi:hypothetical protein